MRKTPKTLHFLTIVVTAICLCTSNGAAAVGEVGLVLDVQGNVSVTAAGKTQPLAALNYLAPGQEIRLDAQAAMVATVHAEQAEYNFTGPTTLKVGEKSIAVTKGKPPTVRKLPGAIVTAARSAVQHRLAMAGMIMRGGSRHSSEVVFDPADDTTVMTRNPRFEWRTGQHGPFLVTLNHANGREMARAQVVESPWQLPASVRLKFGEAYEWSVGAVVATTVQPLGSARFITLTKVDNERLTKLKAASARSVADAVLYALALEDAGINSEARKVWAAIRQARPDAETNEKSQVAQSMPVHLSPLQ